MEDTRAELIAISAIHIHDGLVPSPRYLAALEEATRAELIAISAIHIHDGFVSSPRYLAALENWQETAGMIDRSRFFAESARLLHAVAKYIPSSVDLPLVWEYRMAEPLGAFIAEWMAANDEVPNAKALETEVKRLDRELQNKIFKAVTMYGRS